MKNYFMRVDDLESLKYETLSNLEKLILDRRNHWYYKDLFEKVEIDKVVYDDNHMEILATNYYKGGIVEKANYILSNNTVVKYEEEESDFKIFVPGVGFLIKKETEEEYCDDIGLSYSMEKDIVYISKGLTDYIDSKVPKISQIDIYTHHFYGEGTIIWVIRPDELTEVEVALINNALIGNI